MMSVVIASFVVRTAQNGIHVPLPAKYGRMTTSDGKNSLDTWRSRLIFKVIGAKHWEKFFAWRHPASAIYVTLKVVK